MKLTGLQVQALHELSDGMALMNLIDKNEVDGVLHADRPEDGRVFDIYLDGRIREHMVGGNVITREKAPKVKWAKAPTIERAILDGENETGDTSVSDPAFVSKMRQQEIDETR